MTAENWIQFFVPITGIVIAALSASLTYYYTKKNQVSADERRLKEKCYLEYIAALNINVLTDDMDEAKSQLSSAHNQILLLGGADVVKKLRAFSIYVGQPNTNAFSQKEHDRLITDLVKSMRLDLYKGRAVNKGYPEIALSGKNRRQR